MKKEILESSKIARIKVKATPAPLICDFCGCEGHNANGYGTACAVALQRRIKELEAENARLRQTILKYSIKIETQRKNRHGN